MTGHPRIRARDIGERLAKQPAYLGATPGVFYSLAQHSVLLAQELARTEGASAALYALVHHGADAFGTSSARLLALLHASFDLDWPMPASTARAFAHAHNCVEITEISRLFSDCEERMALLRNVLGASFTRRWLNPVAWDRALDLWLGEMAIQAAAAGLPHLPALEGII